MNLPYMDREKESEYESLPKHQFSRVFEIFLEAAFKKKSQGIFCKNDFPELISQQHRFVGMAGPHVIERRGTWSQMD